MESDAGVGTDNDDGRTRTYERFGWRFSGGLLATRPAAAVVDGLSRLLTRSLALVAAMKERAQPRPRDSDHDEE
jgi:hypothetical protein